MEAAATGQARELSGDKAKRIVDAMRASVARRGMAGSTFDHVAREAGVSRGLLHYYFGTKERLIIEVVRRDSDLRIGALEEALAGARTAEDLIDVLVSSLEALVGEDRWFAVLSFELFTLGQRNEEIAAEMAALGQRARDHVAEQIAAKEREGVLTLGAAPEAVAAVLLALGDGLAVRMLSEPSLPPEPLLRAGIVAARALLSDRR